MSRCKLKLLFINTTGSFNSFSGGKSGCCYSQGKFGSIKLIRFESFFQGRNTSNTHSHIQRQDNADKKRIIYIIFMVL